jgi:hypothetical protein
VLQGGETTGVVGIGEEDWEKGFEKTEVYKEL